ncbi:hypothetical protein ETB97_002432 [Aspergillus alliaceus]|uniref:3-hydroxyacyl-CoA dehydrogenase C-terminal domain-containing protein n=1 Tax=Petromyces alliaceus TaxID=209559 RepID=A0A8H6E549_PETAA|nr:hypothetical protein ETB97_002432 [Aspergillus burnettii]
MFTAAGYDMNLSDQSEEALSSVLDYSNNHITKYPSADCTPRIKLIFFPPESNAVKITFPRRRLVCNMHLYLPPEMRPIELMLMTAGETYPEVFPFPYLGPERRWDASCYCWQGVNWVSSLIPPFWRRPSNTQLPSFVFNCLCVAVKRETLAVFAEDISSPTEIDTLWKEMWSTRRGPCALIDKIGLDTVAFIDDNYIYERHINSAVTLD